MLCFFFPGFGIITVMGQEAETNVKLEAGTLKEIMKTLSRHVSDMGEDGRRVRTVGPTLWGEQYQNF